MFRYLYGKIGHQVEKETTLKSPQKKQQQKVSLIRLHEQEGKRLNNNKEKHYENISKEKTNTNRMG